MRIEADSPLICTRSGRYVNPLDLRFEDVHIEDIAHALSNQCRFTGHTTGFYSVAQHSVLVSLELEGTGHELWGLLHDAFEAYLLDLSRPLKEDPRFGRPYRVAEARGMEVVAFAFGLPWPEPDAVKVADLRLLATERRDLMPPGTQWGVLEGVTPRAQRILTWSPPHAQATFLYRYKELGGEL